MINKSMKQNLKSIIDKSANFLRISAYALFSAYVAGCDSAPPNKMHYDYEKNTTNFDIEMHTGLYSTGFIAFKDEDNNGLVDKIVVPGAPDFVIAVDIGTHPDYLDKLNMYPARGLPYAMDGVQIRKCTEFAKKYSEFAYYLDSLEYAQKK